ncbi:MAG: ABC transporter permease [Gammaproteobacteria bacterium]
MQELTHSIKLPAGESHGQRRFWRALRSVSPAIVLMLALALGTSGAIFTVLNGFLWRPLPYPHAGRLVLIRERLMKIGLTGAQVSFRTYSKLKNGTPDIRAAGTLDITGGSVTIHGIRHTVFGGIATPSLFRALAVPPLLGHWPQRAAGRPGGPHEALLGYGFWKSVFGGSPEAIGQSFRYDGTRYRIVGVMPKAFYTEYPGADFWIPRVLTPARTRDDNINHTMIARLRRGVSLTKLNVYLKGYGEHLLAGVSPAARAHAERDGYLLSAEGLHRSLIDLYLGDKPGLLVFLALIGILLPLIAVVNSVNLALVRARKHASVFAVRRALGASTTRLLQLALGEYLLTLTPVILGSLLIADLCSGFFHSLIVSAVTGPISVTLPFILRFGASSILYVIGAAGVMVSGIILGALFYAGRQSNLAALMRESGGRGTSRSARMMRRGFGGFQILMATLLVMLGLVIIQSLYSILNRPLGFRAHNRVEALVLLPHATSLNQSWTDARPALMSIPDIRSAATGIMVPFNGLVESMAVINAPAPPHESLYVHAIAVSRAYFKTLEIPFMAGRGFSRYQETHHAPVVILSARLAERLFGTVGAIGRTLTLFGKHSIEHSVVGVVGNVAWHPTPAKNIAGTIYLPLGAKGFRFGATNVVLLLKSSSPAFMESIRTTLERATPGAAITHFIALPSMIRGAERLYATVTDITSVFALVALLLTIFGVYAMAAQSSLNRRQEYAIRGALGADPDRITRLALGEAAWMLAVGLALGAGLALLLTRLLQGALYGVGTVNWLADLIGVLLIIATVLVASWMPVRNISRAELGDILKSGAA